MVTENSEYTGLNKQKFSFSEKSRYMDDPGLVTVMAPWSPRVLTASVFCSSLCGLHSQGHLMIQDGCCSNHVHTLACRKQEERWSVCLIPFKTLCRSFTQRLQRSWEVQSLFRMTTCPVKNWEFCYWGGRELLGDKKQSLHRNQLHSVHIYAIKFKLNTQHGPEILILQYFPNKLAFPLFVLPKSSLMSLNPSLSWCLCPILCRENRCGRVTSHCHRHLHPLTRISACPCCLPTWAVWEVSASSVTLLLVPFASIPSYPLQICIFLLSSLCPKLNVAKIEGILPTFLQFSSFEVSSILANSTTQLLKPKIQASS